MDGRVGFSPTRGAVRDDRAGERADKAFDGLILGLGKGFPRIIDHWGHHKADTHAYKDGDALTAQTTRPAGDTRSAEQIIKDNPLYAQLAEKDKQTLRDKCGDIEHDADAAFRAVQVLHRIEKYDEEGRPIVSGDVGNDRIDGWSRADRNDPWSEAYHGTEAGRFQDFGKYGWDTLKGERVNAEPFKPDQVSPDHAPPRAPYKDGDPLTGQTARPDGDLRTAGQIIKDNPLYAQLSEKDKQALRDKCGDIEHDADAAFRAVQVLHRIEKYDEDGKEITGGDVGNGKIDGWTRADRNDPKSEAQHGTEAGRFQDFTKYGWDTLKGPRTDAEPAHNPNPADDAGIAQLKSEALEKAIKDAGGDASKIKPEYFTQDGYGAFKGASGADKLAELIQLSKTAASLKEGIQHFLDENTLGTPDVPPTQINNSIDEWRSEHPGEPSPGEQQQAVLDQIDKDIDKLANDPDVQAFLKDKVPAALQSIVGADPALKAQLTKELGLSKDPARLVDDWKQAVKNTDKNPNAEQTQQVVSAIAQYVSKPAFYGQALGQTALLSTDAYDRIQADPTEKQQFENARTYITSGQEIKDLLQGKDGKPGLSLEAATAQASADLGVINQISPINVITDNNSQFAHTAAEIQVDQVTAGKSGEDLLHAMGFTGADDPKLLQFIKDHMDDFDPSHSYTPQEVLQQVTTLAVSYHLGLKFTDALSKLPDPSTTSHPMDPKQQELYKTGLTNAAAGLLLLGTLGVNVAQGTADTNLEVHNALQGTGLLVEYAGKGYLYRSDRIAELTKETKGADDIIKAAEENLKTSQAKVAELEKIPEAERTPPQKVELENAKNNVKYNQDLIDTNSYGAQGRAALASLRTAQTQIAAIEAVPEAERTPQQKTDLSNLRKDAEKYQAAMDSDPDGLKAKTETLGRLTSYGKDALNAGKLLGGIAGFAGMALGIQGAQAAVARGDRVEAGIDITESTLFGLIGASATGEAVSYFAGRVAGAAFDVAANSALRVGLVAAENVFGAGTAIFAGIATVVALGVSLFLGFKSLTETMHKEDEWYKSIQDGLAGTGIKVPDFYTLTEPPYGYPKYPAPPSA